MGRRQGDSAGRLRICALRSLVPVSDKSERRAARSVVAEYHHAELARLLARVAEAVDRYREGELDTFDVDQVLFQYSRAAKELWKYCNLGQAEMTAAIIREQPPHDWWERGAPRRRGSRTAGLPGRALSCQTSSAER